LQATVNALAETAALDERVKKAVGLGFFIGATNINLGKGHIEAIRQRLRASLDDVCFESVAGERTKLARVGRMKNAVNRLFFGWKSLAAEAVPRIPTPARRFAAKSSGPG
jgi:hypothetical protein